MWHAAASIDFGGGTYHVRATVRTLGRYADRAQRYRAATGRRPPGRVRNACPAPLAGEHARININKAVSHAHTYQHAWSHAGTHIRCTFTPSTRARVCNFGRTCVCETASACRAYLMHFLWVSAWPPAAAPPPPLPTFDSTRWGTGMRIWAR